MEKTETKGERRKDREKTQGDRKTVGVTKDHDGKFGHPGSGVNYDRHCEQDPQTADSLKATKAPTECSSGLPNWSGTTWSQVKCCIAPTRIDK